MTAKLFALIIGLLLISPQAHAETAMPSPTALAGAPLVGARDIRPLLMGGAALVDTRSTHDYLAGRIPGALHVVYREYSAREADYDASQDGIDAFLTRLRRFVPLDQPVIFYCNGAYCWKSYKSSRAALAAGYAHVFWFRGGLSEWQDVGMDVDRE